MNYDIIIIGSGPGGYVAGIRASQCGMKVGIVEMAELGGVCLNCGCIPAKSLLMSAEVFNLIKNAEKYGIKINGKPGPDLSMIIKRAKMVVKGMSNGLSYLFQKNKIAHIEGRGKLVDNQTVEVTGPDGKKNNFRAKHIILATGARSRELPGLKQDGRKIIGYREALILNSLPESMLIVGSGAIGIEFAHFYNIMGTKITLIEFMPSVVPLADKDISAQLARSFKQAGINIMLNSTVESIDTKGKGCNVVIKTKEGNKRVEADIVLSATGITPNIENMGIEELDIKLDNGKIKVDEYYRTNVEGVYAIGDIVHGPALAHVASKEGIICVEKIADKNPLPLRYDNIPACIYTSPEIASVGMTEKAARDAGYNIKVGKFPFSASGKANAAGHSEGFVKLIFDAGYGELLGCCMIGANVTEMIAEVVVARNLETTGYEIINSIHPHPTMSEAVMEAAATAYQKAIHV